jgi:hypothetical protein
MKKVTLVLAVLGIMFVACRQESNVTKDEVVTDTTCCKDYPQCVDSVKVDTNKVDSTTVDSVTNK